MGTIHSFFLPVKKKGGFTLPKKKKELKKSPASIRESVPPPKKIPMPKEKGKTKSICAMLTNEAKKQVKKFKDKHAKDKHANAGEASQANPKPSIDFRSRCLSSYDSWGPSHMLVSQRPKRNKKKYLVGIGRKPPNPTFFPPSTSYPPVRAEPADAAPFDAADCEKRWIEASSRSLLEQFTNPDQFSRERRVQARGGIPDPQIIPVPAVDNQRPTTQLNVEPLLGALSRIHDVAQQRAFQLKCLILDTPIGAHGQHHPEPQLAVEGPKNLYAEGMELWLRLIAAADAVKRQNWPPGAVYPFLTSEEFPCASKPDHPIHHKLHALANAGITWPLGPPAHQCQGCPQLRFMPDRPFRSQLSHIRFWATGDIYVCQNTGSMHHCGATCQMAVHTGQGATCPISGLFIGDTINYAHADGWKAIVERQPVAEEPNAPTILKAGSGSPDLYSMVVASRFMAIPEPEKTISKPVKISGAAKTLFIDEHGCASQRRRPSKNITRKICPLTTILMPREDYASLCHTEALKLTDGARIKGNTPDPELEAYHQREYAIGEHIRRKSNISQIYEHLVGEDAGKKRYTNACIKTMAIMGTKGNVLEGRPWGPNALLAFERLQRYPFPILDIRHHPNNLDALFRTFSELVGDVMVSSPSKRSPSNGMGRPAEPMVKKEHD